MPESANYQDYETEPVCYCSKCYSLKIQYEEAIDSDCCMECGCSDIETTSIEEWEKLYENRYGHKFVEKNQDPTKSFFFKTSIKDLKKKVFNSQYWKNIIFSIYPHFPKYWGKEDSVILFFDKLIKDNKLDDLKLLLYHHLKFKHNGREEVKKQQDEGSEVQS